MSASQASYFPGTDSSIVNGRLVGVMGADAWSPTVVGPTLQGVVSPAPNVPPAAYGLGAMPSSVDPNQLQTAAAAANPWDPRVSPLPFVIFAFVIGFIGLRYIHWEF